MIAGMKVLARFKRGEDRIKIVPDCDPAYHQIITTPGDLRQAPTVERFRMRYLLLHLWLYELEAQRLELCRVCEGTGYEWYQDSHGEATQDVCPACQGEGGTELYDRIRGQTDRNGTAA